MIKLFDGFIFDVDGTLTSTNQLIFDSFNFIAKRYLNKTFSDDEIVAMFGPTEDVILKEWCGDNFEEARTEYYKYYSDNHWKAKLYPGIKEMTT
jgi:pyrophosphatase PpaX